MANRELNRERKPQAGQQPPGGQRKNDEEVGEPIQLDDEKSKSGQQQQPNKPGMPSESEHGGQHQGGGQQGGQRPGGGIANR